MYSTFIFPRSISTQDTLQLFKIKTHCMYLKLCCKENHISVHILSLSRERKKLNFSVFFYYMYNREAEHFTMDRKNLTHAALSLCCRALCCSSGNPLRPHCFSPHIKHPCPFKLVQMTPGQWQHHVYLFLMLI